MSMLGLEITFIVLLLAVGLYFFDLWEKALVALGVCAGLISIGTMLGIGLHIANWIIGGGLG